MPMPEPGPTEDEDTFISRCMGDDTMNEDYPEQEQRSAVCYSQWRTEHGGEPPSDGRTGLANGAGRRFEAAMAADATGELYVYDFIGGGLFSDGVTAKAFRDELAKVKGAKTLHVYVNSPGGDVFEAQAIHTQLTRHGARKIMHVDGEASSAASLIVMAGDERRMARGAMMMIHEPWGMAIGPADDLRHTAEMLDKLTGEYAAEYARASGMRDARVRELMKAETWMTADEALDLGFVDEVDGQLDAAAARVMAGFDRTHLRYAHAVPAAVTSGLAPQGFEDFDRLLERVQRQGNALRSGAVMRHARGAAA